MKDRYNVLFVCTGNSARSLMAEALANALGRERLQAFSAGSHPEGQAHPLTLQVLESAGLATANLRSKSWDEFAGAGAPEMDLIITVCDRAAGETCPTWPGPGHRSLEHPGSGRRDRHVRADPQSLQRRAADAAAADCPAAGVTHRSLGSLVDEDPGGADRPNPFRYVTPPNTTPFRRSST